MGRQEKTGAEGSGAVPRCKNPIKRPTPTCHLSSCIQSRKLTITIKSILFFQSIKKVSLHLYVVSVYCGEIPCVAPGNSDRRFLQLLFFPVFPHTFPSFFAGYNRENLQSETSYFYISKKYFPLRPCVVRIVMENTIHSVVFFDGVLSFLVEAEVAKKSGGVAGIYERRDLHFGPDGNGAGSGRNWKRKEPRGIKYLEESRTF